ncbi:MAG: septum formation initiator family protein [Flavobacteriaceae bacterium]
MKKYFGKKLFSLNRSYLLYGGILLGFIVWMLFIDTHSWTIHNELNQEIKKLENQKKALQQTLDEDQKTIQKLNNKDSLEEFAREAYGHKKELETVFIIETSDSLR